MSERYSRQQDLVPMKKLLKHRVTVVGVGAIGRQVALQLAAMGVPKMQLIDFDKVEEGNLAAQGFFEVDLGTYKVDAVAEICSMINSNLVIECSQEAFRIDKSYGDVVFCCVDRMDARRQIWDCVKDKTEFFVDSRMSAEVIRRIVVAGSDKGSKVYYPTTLFSEAEAFPQACTAKTTIYTANIAAGLVCCEYAKWLRDMPFDYDMMLNMLSNELIDYGKLMTEARNEEIRERT